MSNIIFGNVYYKNLDEEYNLENRKLNRNIIDSFTIEEKVSFALRILSANTHIKYSEDAKNLILGTIAQESAYGKYREQIGGGPAKGICQIEFNTAKDIFQNYLIFRKKLSEFVLKIAPDLKNFNDKKQLENELINNDIFSIIMCRIHYLRVKEALPKNDVEAYAKYWKKYYNTKLGKGTFEEFIKNYNYYVLNLN